MRMGSSQENTGENGGPVTLLILATAPESRRQRTISNRDLLKEQDAENSSQN